MAGVLWIDTQISRDILGNRENSLFFIKFDRFSLKVTATWPPVAPARTPAPGQLGVVHGGVRGRDWLGDRDGWRLHLRAGTAEAHT